MAKTAIDKEDVSQVAELSIALAKHCEQNEKSDKKVRDDLKKLSWLAEPEFKGTLLSIINDRRMNIYIGKRVVQAIGIIGAILGIVWGSIQIWKSIK
jgi:hypothetical protein